MSSTYQTIELVPGDGVATLYLNRPDALNALNERMKYELIDALRVTEKDEGCRCLILTGRGRAFSAGVDLERLREAGRSAGRPGESSHFGSLDFPEAFVRYEKPIVAAINGPCHGFGATVSLVCDIRLAGDQAEFGFGFLRLGLTPEFGSSFFLPRLVGFGNAMELIMTARIVKAGEAVEIGLVNKVLPSERLMEEARSLAGRIASFPPSAVRRAKKVLRDGMNTGIAAVLAGEMEHFMSCVGSDEHKKALEEFVARMKRGR